MHKFFIVCPLGFESILAQEVHLKWLNFGIKSIPNIKILKGGIEIELPLEQGLKLNYWLRSATRVLLRFHTQKCRDVSKLFQIITKIPWKSHLQQENVAWIISTKNSRLFNTKKIEQTCQQALASFFHGQPLPGYHRNKTYPDQKIYLRLENDEMTISLDTSGELLHKREKSTYRANASIRETYASSLLIYLTEGDNTGELIDPMCGSATFLNEYRNMYAPLERKFSFHSWKLQREIAQPLPSTHFKGAILGHDLNETVVKKLHKKGLPATCSDFFKLKIKTDTIVLNPPYGKRIAIQGDKQKYFNQLVEHLQQQEFKRAGIIIPKIYSQKIQATKRLAFNQNGIQVEFLVF